MTPLYPILIVLVLMVLALLGIDFLPESPSVQRARPWLRVLVVLVASLAIVHFTHWP